MTAINNDLYHDQEEAPIFQTPAIYQRTRCWTISDDEQHAQMDASAKYELYRVLSTLELRHLAGRRGHNVQGFGRQQIIATLIEKEESCS